MKYYKNAYLSTHSITWLNIFHWCEIFYLTERIKNGKEKNHKK